MGESALGNRHRKASATWVVRGHHTWRVIDGGGNSRNCSVARPTSSDLLGEVRLVDSITDNVYRGVGVGVRGANFG